MTKKSKWMEALGKAGLEIKSGRDALRVKGWLDTGNYALNWAISGRLLRGYPQGHSVELFGDPGTGKSYLVTRALAMAQEQGGVAFLDDTERAYNLEHTEALGVNLEELAVPNPSSHTVKEHLDVARKFIEGYKSLGKEVPAVLACDSLSQLSTEHEMKEGLDKKDMTKAPQLKALFRIIGGELSDLPVIYLCTSHVIANIGNLFQKRTTSGGGGPKYYSTVRLDLRAVSKIKRGEGDYSGVICTVFVEKNRIAPPWKRVQLAIPFNRPISRSSGLLPLLLNLGVVEVKGTSLCYKDERIGRALKTKGKFLEQDELGEQLLDQYPEVLEETDKGLEAGKYTALTEHEESDADEAEDNEE